MRRVIGFLSLLAMALLVAPAAQAEGCPPFSAPVPGHENDDVVPCRCVPGFEIRNKQCRPVLRPKPQPVMRPMTPSECQRMEADIKTDSDHRCSAQFYDCLTARGMSSESAWCAASLLLVASSRTRENAVGAIITCGQQAQGAYRACAAAWDTCSLDAARTYEAGLLQRCPGG